MTDPAKLATEITQGKWEVRVETHENNDKVPKFVRVTTDKQIIIWWGFPDIESIANATAISLVPEMIAEVLRLREEREQVFGILEEALKTCNQYVATATSRQKAYEFGFKTHNQALQLIAKLLT